MDAQHQQNRRKFSPVVERLESFQLLSGMVHGIVAHQAAPVQVEATKAVAVVDLQGTIRGTAKISGSTFAVAGSGNLGVVGTASTKFDIHHNSILRNITLSTKQGQIVLAKDASTSSSGVSFIGNTTAVDSGKYDVVGGTRAYAHAIGSGTLTEAVTLGKGDKITVNLTFS